MIAADCSYLVGDRTNIAVPFGNLAKKGSTAFAVRDVLLTL